MKMIAPATTSPEPASEVVNDAVDSQSTESPHQSTPGSPQEHIAILVENIEPPGTRETVRMIFDDLLRLLECLRLLESNLRQVDPTQETLAILEVFRYEASTLLDLIRLQAMNDRPNQALSDTLDGIAFAVSHDLERSFDGELSGPIHEEPSHISHGRFIHVLGMLTNCLQQSVITLAQVFDPALDGSKLFNDSQVRLKQSLLLCRDLSELVQLVQISETRLDQQLATSIIRRVERFRNESMYFLMYRDWKEFENFNGKILASTNDPVELGSVLHTFLCYLRALLAQVKLRAVLADVFCDFFEDELDGQADPAWSQTETRLAFEMFSLT